ncbi:MAG: ABC transporter permease [Syntrophobacteraceae bacterium]|nr:ABC transporter permease [Syntrophobacteraceae bacterium]
MDRFLGIIRQSVSAVRAFKLRTLFCLISVSLGISSVTIIVAATEGAYQKAFEIVEMFGPDSLLLLSGSDEARAVGQRDKTITLDDGQAIREAFPIAYLVTPMTSVRDVTVSYKNNKYQTFIVGSTDDYSRTWTWPVVQGSDLTQEDVRGLRNVGLIGQKVVDELFQGEDPVGKYIFVRGIPVQIVGVLMERGTSPTGASLDDRIVLPVTTVMRKFQNETKYVNAFRIRIDDQRRIPEFEEELRIFLRERHGLQPGQPDDFRIITPKEITRFLVALTGSLVAFLGIVGVISLIVAGFVLANLFLLSVRERTSEIGIRRSVGAKKRDIMLQFLGEAVIITTLGGIAGFMLGVGASKLLTIVARFPVHFSWRPFAIGLVLSWVIGIAFGLQPASKAANLKPIEAIKG